MDWFSIKAMGAHAEISIYDEIGIGGVSAKQFIEQLKSMPNVRTLDLRINSPGGSVFEGLAIYNALKRHPATVNVYIDGIAASMGSAIAMAGDRIEMAENALLMIHDPIGVAIGRAEDMKKTGATLEKVKQSLIGIYAGRTGRDKDEISELMAEETWFDAHEALESGFIDVVGDQIEMAAVFDLSKFKNAPNYEVNNMAVNREDVLKQETGRLKKISSMFNAYGDEYSSLMNKCKDDVNCTAEMANKMLLDKLGKGSTSLSHEDPSKLSMYSGIDRQSEFKDAIVDGLLMREGIHIENPHPGAKDMATMSMVDVARQVLSHNNVSTMGMNSAAVISNAITHTSGDFPKLLSNAAGKSLLKGYDNEPASYRMWTGVENAPDFKIQSRNRLSEAPDLDIVREGSEYKYGSFGESQEQFSLVTYGKLFSITRQALINDDLSAFTRLPLAFGLSAARKEGDVCYAVLTANANMSDGVALFHASHNNLESAAALSVTSLSDARAAMRKQTGVQGIQVLNVVPKYLIVPAAKEGVAEELIASIVNPAKSNDTTNLNFIRSLTLVVDARLDADSETTWYLASNYNQIESVARAYLEGDQGVYIEQRPGWDIDGVEYKCRQDFAAKALDWRGLIKNPGA